MNALEPDRWPESTTSGGDNAGAEKGIVARIAPSRLSSIEASNEERVRLESVLERGRPGRIASWPLRKCAVRIGKVPMAQTAREYQSLEELDPVQPEAAALSGLVVIEPTVYSDERGFFFESYNRRQFEKVTGLSVDFVQDNHSRSVRGVLRGLHYQYPAVQGKLVRVIVGAVWDVAVDIRRSSPTFTQWFGIELSAANHLQLWIPPGFAHGFVTLTNSAEVLYKTTEFYYPEDDRALRWNDPTIEIDWPLGDIEPQLSAKDDLAPLLAGAELFD